jgi:hypothetical protein
LAVLEFTIELNEYVEIPVTADAAVLVRTILFAVVFIMSIVNPVLFVWPTSAAPAAFMPVGTVHAVPIKGEFEQYSNSIEPTVDVLGTLNENTWEVVAEGIALVICTDLVSSSAALAGRTTENSTPTNSATTRNTQHF